MNLRATLRTIVRDALKLDRSGIELGFALRCTAGVAIPLIVAGYAGASLAGVSAAYGALVTGFASRQGVYRTRAAGMVLTAVALAASGLAGALTGPHPIANIVLVALWAAMFAMCASLGRAATVASINSVVAFVIFSNPPYDGSNPLFQAAMIVAGGLLQTLLLVLVWPLQRFRTERHALAKAYRVLAVYAADIDAGDLGFPSSASLFDVRAALADPQPFGSRNELAAFEALADEAERLRATLAALTSDNHMLADLGRDAIARDVARVGHTASTVLEALASGLDRGAEPDAERGHWDAVNAAVRDVEAHARPGSTPLGDTRALAGQLRSSWRAARAAANGGVATTEHVPVVRFELAIVRDAFDTLRANASFDSIYARHALRLAVTIAIAVLAQRLLPIAHGQWIALTVALVLRPDFSSTFTRGFARVGGTLAGAVIASAIAAFHPPAEAYIALAIVFAGLSFALFNVSYAVFSATITGYVVFLLAFGGAPEHAAAADRVIATAIGGVLALVAYIAWPSWTRERVADDLAQLLEAQAKNADFVLRAFLDPAGYDAAAAHEAQLRTWRARSNAEAAVDQLKGEPVRARALSLQAAQGVLAASRRFGIAALTLTARIGDARGTARPMLETLIADLDVAFSLLVAALRGGTAPPPLPPIRDDQTMLTRALRDEPDAHWELLISETDLIVDSVDTMADVLRRR